MAIGVLTFLVGYISGKMYNRAKAPVEAPAARESFAYKPKKETVIRLDSEKVKEETSAKPETEPTFTFPEKLNQETTEVTQPGKNAKAGKPEAKPEAKPAPAIPEPKPEPKQKAAAPKADKKPARKDAKPAPKPAAKPAAKSDPVKAPAGRMLTIQVASFRHKKDAEALANKLKRKNYHAYVVPFRFKGETWHRTRVGVFKTTAAAKRVAARLERDQSLPTLLVTYQR